MVPVIYWRLVRYLPTWFPGVSFVQTAGQFRKRATAFCDIPCAFVKQRLAQGDLRPSFLSNLLQASEGLEDDESVLKWSAAAIYAGGADTVCVSLGISLRVVMAVVLTVY